MRGGTAAPIGVIGAGAWGTALANAAAAAGRDVVLWCRDPATAARLADSRENERYLPGVALERRVRPTALIAHLAASEAALVVTPAQVLGETLTDFGAELPSVMPLVICAKGISRGTGRFLSQVVSDLRPGAPVAVLSGPSFAGDVARGLPTAVTLAAEDAGLAKRLAEALSGPTFRVYHGTDVRGVEIGGAAKNVLAIACGIVHGRGLGDSAKAALTARGFAELMRFARAFGGRAETLMGLSGLGDLVLTCNSPQSRNFSYGDALGRGLSPEAAAGGKLAEGAATAGILADLARQKAIDMPIAQAVAAVVAETLSVEAAIEALMTRPLKAEDA